MALTLPKQQEAPKINLGDPATREALMSELGIKKPKANMLKRLTSFLSAFETGNAVYKAARTGNIGEGISQYFKDVGTGIGGAFSGAVDENKKTYADVLDLAGVENKAVRGVVGFIGDVALDPSTYLTFGTASLGGKVSKVGGKALTKEGRKIATLALQRADNELASIAGKSFDKLTKEELSSAAGKFAAKHGITLTGPVGERLVPQIAEEFARKSVVDYGKKTGLEVFSHPAARFMGKELFSMSEKGARVAGDILNPTEMAFRNLNKVPLVKDSLEKTIGVYNSFKAGFGKLFDPLYAANRGLVGTVGREAQLMQDYVNSQVAKFGADADKVMEELSKVKGDLSLLPHLVEGINPKALPELEQFYKHIDNIGDNTINKFFQTTISSDLSENAQKFVKAFDAGDVDMMKTITNAIPDKEMQNVFDKQIKYFEKTGGQYVKIGGSLILNDMPLAKLAQSLRDEANFDLQILKDLDLPALENYFARKALNKGGEEFAKNAAGNFVNQAINAEKVLGKERVYEFMLQGIQEGDITYAVEDLLKGRSFDALDKATQKKVRGEITSRIIERRVKVQAARQYHTFLSYIRDSALNDAGEKLSFDVFGKKADDVIGDTGKTLAQLRKEGWRSPKGTGNMLKGYIMPDEAANVLERSYKAFFSDEGTNEVAKLFDKVNSIWKTSVTTWFPAFHFRNGISNMFTNAIAGVIDPRRYKEAMDIQKYANALAKHGSNPEKLAEMGARKIGRYRMDDILELAERYGVVGQGGYWTEISKGLMDTRPGVVKRYNPLSKDFVLTKAGGAVGNAVESNARLAHFVDRLIKGDGIEDAAMSVKKYLFDYGDLTDFEKNVMRRVAPFYTWTRKNTELWSRIMVSNPGKFGATLKGMRDIQDSFTNIPEEDIEKLPAWARAGVSVVSGGGKTINAVTGFGLPTEGFASTLGSILGTDQQSALNMLGPVPKGVLEQATGISLFTGKPISEDTNGKKFRKMPGFVKDAIGYKEIERTGKDGSKYIEYMVDPDAKYYLGLFAGRFTSEASKLAEMQGGADSMQIVNFLTGVKRYEFNLDEEEAKRDKEAVRALLTELEKQGYASSFKSTNLTKEAQIDLSKFL